MDIYEKRQQSKANAEAYRQAARRLSGGRVGIMASPVEVDGGAFVEVTLFIPKEEMQKEKEETTV